jgi:hypothetical protein
MARQRKNTTGNQREAKRKWAAAQSARTRDVGPLRDDADPARKESCRLDFRRWCEVYFANVFKLRWSADHLKTIGKIEEAVLRGALFAVCMPRASGKSSLCEAAAMWSICFGHRHFVVLIGANASAACEQLESIKSEVEANELLQSDFPKITQPIEALERIVNRAKGQTCNGEPTFISWNAAKVVFPTVAGSPASGSVIAAAGIEARLRGMKHKTAAGEAIRPDFVICDDPQTDEVASSPTECDKRERKIAGAILGLGGPNVKISGIMPLTVIAQDDVAHRVLDRKRHPEWNGERMQLVYQFPKNEGLWARYAELWREGQQAGKGTGEATAFYVANRQAMDEGAIISWPERYRPDEISGIQYAMNLKIMDERAFMSEYQSDPMPLVPPQPDDLKPEQITERVNRHERGVVPTGCTRLTAMIDVQQRLLYYAVVAWDEVFGGHVVDYSSYPKQARGHFLYRDARPTLEDAHEPPMEAQLYAGLAALVNELLGREWRTDGGAGMRVERLLIDMGFQGELVKRFCRQSPYAAVVMPSSGHGITAGANPMEAWARREGERRGLNWIVPAPKPGEVRRVVFDSNFWKSFLRARLAAPVGAPGALMFFGDRPQTHRMIAEHLCAETRVRTEGRGRQLDEWRLPPSQPDNHFLDTVVGCCVAASMLGVSLKDLSAPPRKKKPSVPYSELYRQARERERGYR